MKKIFTPIFICVLALNLHAQAPSSIESKKEIIKPVVDSTLVLSLDNTIKTFYNTISGEKEVERNWKQFKYLFKPNAKLIPSFKDKSGTYQVRYLSPDEYIKNSSKWLVQKGFIEKEIHRKTNTFGNIAQVFSTYEAYNSELDEKPFMRGINSVQLLNDGERWWIVNIYWTQESYDRLIPKEHLPKK